jgi:glutamate/tyrosine decarboxylase-like PLP-dependent enzyme
MSKEMQAGPASALILEESVRRRLWRRTMSLVEEYVEGVETARVAPLLELEKLQALLAPFDFEQPREPLEMLDEIAQGLWRYQVHTPHPRYFGLFNPAPTAMGIAADTLVAAFNPQLAAWSHSPLAAEIEQHLVRAFGSKFGYDPEQTDGTFASGGAEANHTAMLTALVHSFPDFARRGVRGLDAQPVVYVSGQSHHSFIKAARFCGLGTDAVREIPVDDDLRMNVGALASQIAGDRSEGFAPLMIVATAGTTSAGIVDPIGELAGLAAVEGLWLHVDAAWGGAAAILPELRPLLAGVERADSITFDAHKWLSVPMAAGIYLTRHPEILARTCGYAADYMPRDAAGLDVTDPYSHSLQWSRRFTGLKVFLSLAVAGWEGYETAIRHQVAMGELLRGELASSGWETVNETRLPVVCFVDAGSSEGRSARYLEEVAREVVISGRAWISTARLGPERTALRACITNYRTQAADVQALVRALNEARQKLNQSS